VRGVGDVELTDGKKCAHGASGVLRARFRRRVNAPSVQAWFEPDSGRSGLRGKGRTLVRGLSRAVEVVAGAIGGVDVADAASGCGLCRG
jgi:hypothetical protein